MSVTHKTKSISRLSLRISNTVNLIVTGFPSTVPDENRIADTIFNAIGTLGKCVEYASCTYSVPENDINQLIYAANFLVSTYASFENVTDNVIKKLLNLCNGKIHSATLILRYAGAASLGVEIYKIPLDFQVWVHRVARFMEEKESTSAPQIPMLVS